MQVKNKNNDDKMKRIKGVTFTDNNKIAKFIKKQRIAFICSVDESGFPNVKAMLKPRKIDGICQFYFSTNTSSMRVNQYTNNPNASIYS